MTSPPRSGLPQASEKFYRQLLFLYPRAYRKEFGQKMARTFSDCCYIAFQESGLTGLLRLWPGTLLDMTSTALEKHVEEGLLSSRLTVVRVASVGALLGSGLTFATGWSGSSTNLLAASLLFLGGALGLILTAPAGTQPINRRSVMVDDHVQTIDRSAWALVPAVRVAFYLLLGLALLAVADIAQEISVGTSDFVRNAVSQYGSGLAVVALAGPHVVTFGLALWLYRKGLIWAAIPAIFMGAAWTLFALQDLSVPQGDAWLALGVDVLSLLVALAVIGSGIWAVINLRSFRKQM